MGALRSIHGACCCPRRPGRSVRAERGCAQGVACVFYEVLTLCPLFPGAWRPRPRPALPAYARLGQPRRPPARQAQTSWTRSGESWTCWARRRRRCWPPLRGARSTRSACGWRRGAAAAWPRSRRAWRRPAWTCSAGCCRTTRPRARRRSRRCGTPTSARCGARPPCARAPARAGTRAAGRAAAWRGLPGDPHGRIADAACAAGPQQRARLAAHGRAGAACSVEIARSR